LPVSFAVVGVEGDFIPYAHKPLLVYRITINEAGEFGAQSAGLIKAAPGLVPSVAEYLPLAGGAGFADD